MPLDPAWDSFNRTAGLDIRVVIPASGSFQSPYLEHPHQEYGSRHYWQYCQYPALFSIACIIVNYTTVTPLHSENVFKVFLMVINKSIFRVIVEGFIDVIFSIIITDIIMVIIEGIIDVGIEVNVSGTEWPLSMPVPRSVLRLLSLSI